MSWELCINFKLPLFTAQECIFPLFFLRLEITVVFSAVPLFARNLVLLLRSFSTHVAAALHVLPPGPFSLPNFRFLWSLLFLNQIPETFFFPSLLLPYYFLPPFIKINCRVDLAVAYLPNCLWILPYQGIKFPTLRAYSYSSAGCMLRFVIIGPF